MGRRKAAGGRCSSPSRWATLLRIGYQQQTERYHQQGEEAAHQAGTEASQVGGGLGELNAETDTPMMAGAVVSVTGGVVVPVHGGSVE